MPLPDSAASRNSIQTSGPLHPPAARCDGDAGSIGSTADIVDIACGMPFAYRHGCYRLKWDNAYGRAHLAPLPKATQRRDRRHEAELARALARLPLRRHATVSLRHYTFDADRGNPCQRAALQWHVAKGGLLRFDASHCNKAFTVAVDRGGKANWKAVSESRWPRLRALWDFLARMTWRGRRAYRTEQVLLRDLSTYLPAVEIALLRQHGLRHAAAAWPPARSPGGRCRDDTAPAQLAWEPVGLCARVVPVPDRQMWQQVARRDAAGKTIAHHLGALPPSACQTAISALQLISVVSPEALSMLVTDNNGDTPLHCAVRHGHVALVCRFLRMAREQDFAAGLGGGKRVETVLDCARQRGDAAVMLAVQRAFPGRALQGRSAP